MVRAAGDGCGGSDGIARRLRVPRRLYEVGESVGAAGSGGHTGSCAAFGLGGEGNGEPVGGATPKVGTHL